MHCWNVDFLVKPNTKKMEFLLRKVYRTITLRRYNNGSVEVSTDYLLIEISKYKNLYVDGSNVGISTENVDMKT